MAYIPNPLDTTQPDDNTDAETAAAEFRALKAYLKLVGSSAIVWNQNDKDASISLLGGNLIAVKTDGLVAEAVRATFPKSTGHYWWEITVSLLTASMVIGVGQIASGVSQAVGADALSYGYRSDGSSVHAGVAVPMGAAYVTGDIIAVGHNFDTGVTSYYKVVAGVAVLQGTIATGWLTNTNVYPMHSMTNLGDISVANFGGGAFATLALPATYTGISGAGTGITSSAAVNSAVSVSLTAASAGYQYITMTAMGLHVSLPDATSMTVGGPRFLLQNDGQYPFGVRDAAGVLLFSIMPGGSAIVTLKLNTALAGPWGFEGNGLEPGLCLFDSGLLSSTYQATTVFKQSAAFSNDVMCIFLKLASGFAAAAYDNVTKTLGTPITVSATANMVPMAAWKVDATHVIVFYGAAGNHRAQVLALSGTNTLANGTEATTGAGAWSTEDWLQAPKICQLTTTLYSAAMANGAGTVDVRGIEVTAGNTVTIGAAANPTTVAAVIADSSTVYPLDATHSLIIWSEGAGAPFTTRAMVAVHASTVTTFPGAAVNWTALQSASNPAASCQLSATAFIMNDDNNTTTNQRVTPLLVAGTVLTVGAAVVIETAIGACSVTYGGTTGSSRWIPRLFPLSATTALLWYQDTTPSFNRFVVLTDAANVITAGQIMYRSMYDSTSQQGVPLGIGATDLLAVKEYVNGSAFSPVLVPHKINGTAITFGSPIRPASSLGNIQQSSNNIVSTRLASGDYIWALQAGEPFGLAVARSGGDFVRDRGTISQPGLFTMTRPIMPLSANKVAFLGRSRGVTIATPATDQLRFIVTEIATP